MDKLRLSYISSWNVACGIAMYTKHLVDGIRRKGYDVFAYPNTTYYHDILSEVQKNDINVVNFQYEPILYPNLNGLVGLLQRLRAYGTKVVFTLHSEHPRIIPRLAHHVDKFIYHRPPTLIGPDQARVIPMGVPSYEPEVSRKEMRARYGYAEDDIVISTVGFAFKWKTFPGVLDHMVRFIKSKPKYKVQLLISNSDINRNETVNEILHVRQVIQKTRLQRQVWVNDGSFLPQKELSERLYLSDLGYLWSGITTRSSSAAGKEFVTARLPFVITNSTHYHDLVPFAARVTNMTFKGFVDGVFSIVEDDTALSIAREKIAERYQLLNYNDHVNKFIEFYEEVLSE